MTIALPGGGDVEAYVGNMCTRAADEKRQRNSGASARFRQKKKVREKKQDKTIAALQKGMEEKDETIAALQKRIQQLEEEQASCNYNSRETPTLGTAGSFTSQPPPLLTAVDGSFGSSHFLPTADTTYINNGALLRPSLITSTAI